MDEEHIFQRFTRTIFNKHFKDCDFDQDEIKLDEIDILNEFHIILENPERLEKYLEEYENIDIVAEIFYFNKARTRKEDMILQWLKEEKIERTTTEISEGTKIEMGDVANICNTLIHEKKIEIIKEKKKFKVKYIEPEEQK